MEQRSEPPETRGGTAPLPLGTLLAGAGALAIILAGSVLLQVAYAFGPGGLTGECAESLVSRTTGEPFIGAEGVCNIYEAFTSQTQLALAVAAIVIGAASGAVSFLTYRRMSSKRMREQSIAGGVLGAQAIALAIFMLWFRSGEVMVFVRNFFNFEILDGYIGRYIFTGAKNTLLLAFGGEIGGIVIGLLLAVFAISARRSVRAPARTYINFFRGTPLLWQLAFFYFLMRLGLQLDVGAFQTGLLVFSLNTGAYAAEVFRAGIQSIERGQIEAARSLGMTYLQAMRYAIVPQAIRRVIPPLMNEFVILIKDTALIAVLGLGLEELDIFSLSQEGQASTLNATFYVAAAIGYLIVTLPLIRLVNIVEKKMRSGLTGIVGI